jgi:hypothetical protein
MRKKSGDPGMRLRLTAARALNRMGKLLTPDAVSAALADAEIAKSDAGAQLRVRRYEAEDEKVCNFR